MVIKIEFKFDEHDADTIRYEWPLRTYETNIGKSERLVRKEVPLLVQASATSLPPAPPTRLALSALPSDAPLVLRVSSRLRVHVAAAGRAQTAAGVDHDARAAHQIEPAAVRPARATRGGGRVESVGEGARVARPAPVAPLGEWHAVRVSERAILRAGDARGAHPGDRRPAMILGQVRHAEAHGEVHRVPEDDFVRDM